MAVDPASMPYRPCVGIFMFNARGLVFTARRNDVPGGAWQMPQGGVDEGEEPKAAALREIEEETGVRQVEVVGESAEWLRYDLPEPLVGRAWKGRYRGQELKWFAMRFTGDDRDIDVQDVVSPEFDAWKWTPPDALVTMIVPFKRPMYERVVTEFGGLIRAAAAENG